MVSHQDCDRLDKTSFDSNRFLPFDFSETASQEVEENLKRIENKKQARRRRSISLSTSINSAQSEQIKAMLEDSVGCKVDGILVHGKHDSLLFL